MPTWGDQQQSLYSADRGYLVQRFGLLPLPAACAATGATAAARLVVVPAFSGEMIFTLLYQDGAVTLESARATDNLWYALAKSRDWVPPPVTTTVLAANELPPPLHSLKALVLALREAPSFTPDTLDGVSYEQSIFVQNIAAAYDWPNPEVSDGHDKQLLIVDAWRGLVGF